MKYLADEYKYCMLIEGNNPRRINVGLVSRYPFEHVMTNRHKLTSHASPLFSRDCLQVKFNCFQPPLYLYINHFKSMMGGRENTRNRRIVQINEMINILTLNHGEKIENDHVIVLGDFNDYIEAKPGEEDKESSITSLVNHPGLDNVMSLLDESEQWTHFYKERNTYRQLDYLLVSKPLVNISEGKPIVVRNGQPRRATRYNGPRFDGIGEDRPKASDHCPISLDFKLSLHPFFKKS